MRTFKQLVKTINDIGRILYNEEYENDYMNVLVKK